MSEQKIHHSMGVYNNGDRVHNGVMESHLEKHIKYNQTFRPGRALFIDGVCHNEGYLDAERIAAIVEELRKKPVVMAECTQPYS